MSSAMWIILYVSAGAVRGFTQMTSHSYRHAVDEMGDQPAGQLGLFLGFLLSLVLWPIGLSLYLYVLLRRP